MQEESKIIILDQQGIISRLRRMAYEIYERNYLMDKLVIIGIGERGGYLGEQIVSYLNEISSMDIVFVNANIDRESDPISYGVELSEGLDFLKEKHVVVVDDVLYTGRTLLNVVAILLHAGPVSIQTAVLIERGHRSMPISSDIVGFELATTIQQHVSVEIDKLTGAITAYLQ